MIRPKTAFSPFPRLRQRRSARFPAALPYRPDRFASQIDSGIVVFNIPFIFVFRLLPFLFGRYFLKITSLHYIDVEFPEKRF
jgi:hypothetical protein